ncbi:contactin [Parasteatoda tepidariorum]|uniref:contactin n=1 Tax=Parasteatoda tepidariorum TaxID=114398 RepID=UPI00077F8E29|nr:contactin [Parasteatoda tepidariorum]XP_015912442.1 contactin [Parasteatoda tepidariorum]
MISFRILFTFCLSIYCVHSQTCPKNWIDFKDSCYKFTRTPLQTREGAEDMCRTYNADLVAVNTLEEHSFIRSWLRENDPQHRRWFTSGRDDGDNVWIWDNGGSLFSDIDSLFLPMQNASFLRFAAYNYSDLANKWGLQKVDSTELMAYICEIWKENLNQLIITERDIDYGIVVFDKEKIPRGPYFIQEPEAVIFDPGSRKQVNNVALKCVAAGFPSPIYKWYKEEFKNVLVSELVDPLSDPRYTQTDGTLIISSPQQNKDRGNYHCTAENEFGVVVSQTVQLSFGYIGEFNKKRSSDRGKKNRGKSLSCDPPQHYPRVNYYWTRNHWPNFVQEDQRVFVSHDGNLYFSSLENVDEALYSCNVQSTISSSGRNGPSFQFFVEPASSGEKLFFPNNFPKAFPDAPLAGDDVRLECVAYGYPVPKYNWTRKGFTNELPLGAYTENYNRVLMLPKVRVEDVGDYFCFASNGIDSVTKSVPLRIQAKPEFTIPLENKVVDKNSNLVWTCEAFGKPDVTYTWLKNGKELIIENLNPNDRNRYNIYENILSIDEVLERDQGMYQCKASNQLGSSYSSGQLRIITLKPSFAKYPMDNEMFAAEGGNITIPCRPEAAPFPEFTWKRDNYGLSSVGRIKILPNGYLHINPVRRDDEGRYSCIAKNQYGSDYTEGLLIVLSLPRMVDAPHPKVKAVVNDSAELACQAYVGSDMLDLAYIWLQNGLRIDMEKESIFSVGRLPGYLRIENITLAEAGIYHCIVKTAVGRISKSTELVVFGPPGAPGAVLAEDLTATSGKIHWSDGSANGDPITAYTIEGKTNHNSTWIILKENVKTFKNRPESGRREIFLFSVLSPWSIYTFRVSAINGFGKGEPSQPSPLYNTAKDLPHVAPSNVGGGGGKTGSLTITWDPLPPQDWNDNEIWYNISYKPANSDTKFQEISLKNRHNIGLHVVNVGEENYYKPYLVKVQAINSLGPGPYSEEVQVYSAENMPQVQPSGVYALAYNSTALNVTWSPLELNREKIRGKLIGHRIKYWQIGKNPEIDSLILLKRGLLNWGLIVGLQPDTEYYVAVMAYNDAGSGVESEPFLARTFKAAPLRPPTNVRVERISPTSVSVSWRGVLPSTEEEPIKGYKVRYWESDQDMTSAKEVYRYLDGNDLEVVVSGLTMGKVYKLRVLAFSNGGDGKMSSPVREFKIGEASASYRKSVASLINYEAGICISITFFLIFKHHFVFGLEG